MSDKVRLRGAPMAHDLSMIYTAIPIVLCGLVWLSQGGRLSIGLAFVLAAAPLALATPQLHVLLIVAAGAALPWIVSVGVGGLSLSVSDLLLAAAIPFAMSSGDLNRGLRSGGGRSAVLLGAVAGYLLVATFGFLGSPERFELLTIVQRAFIILVPLLCGMALVATPGAIRRFGLAYVCSCVALGLLWILHFGSPGVAGVNKNAGGQMLAGAVLVALVVISRATIRFAAVTTLSIALLATGSRGSLVGLAAGLVALVLLSPEMRSKLSRQARVAIAVCAPALTWFVGSSHSAFLRTFLDNETLDQRHLLAQDATERWQANPSGFGVGAYAPQVFELRQLASNDPHNVYILSLFEGGTVLLIAFLVCAVLPLVLLARHAKSSPLVVLAIAVATALLVRSYFDIYWVRSTPTLAWLLVGAAAASLGFRAGGSRLPAVAGRETPCRD